MTDYDKNVVAPKAGKPVLLVVDDEESVRSIAVRMLQRIGYDALAATGGQAGIDYFRQHAGQVSCVLLDMTMPILTGEAVCLAIREIDPNACIVMMSGHAEEDMLLRMGHLRLAGFLQKPFNMEQMRATITRIAGLPS